MNIELFPKFGRTSSKIRRQGSIFCNILSFLYNSQDFPLLMNENPANFNSFALLFVFDRSHAWTVKVRMSSTLFNCPTSFSPKKVSSLVRLLAMLGESGCVSRKDWNVSLVRNRCQQSIRRICTISLRISENISGVGFCLWIFNFLSFAGLT